MNPALPSLPWIGPMFSSIPASQAAAPLPPLPSGTMVGGAPGGGTALPIGRTVHAIRYITPVTCSQPGQGAGLVQPTPVSPGAVTPVTSSTRQAARAQVGGCPAGTRSGRQEGGQGGHANTQRRALLL